MFYFTKYTTPFSVEFPAVLLNTSTGKIESEFHYYVQPQEHPLLSPFCRELTGITQVRESSFLSRKKYQLLFKYVEVWKPWDDFAWNI